MPEARDAKFLIERELDNFGIRLNQKPPDVKIKKKERGGIDFQWLCPQTKGMNQDIATRILKDSINGATVTFREDVTHDQFIDVRREKDIYSRLNVMNKIDQLTIEVDIIDEFQIMSLSVRGTSGTSTS